MVRAYPGCPGQRPLNGFVCVIIDAEGVRILRGMETVPYWQLPLIVRQMSAILYFLNVVQASVKSVFPRQINCQILVLIEALDTGCALTLLSRSTQLCIPVGSLNPIPSLAGVRAGIYLCRVAGDPT